MHGDLLEHQSVVLVLYKETGSKHCKGKINVLDRAVLPKKSKVQYKTFLEGTILFAHSFHQTNKCMLISSSVQEVDMGELYLMEWTGSETPVAAAKLSFKLQGSIVWGECTNDVNNKYDTVLRCFPCLITSSIYASKDLNFLITLGSGRSHF
jgi:hypothetical protein